MAQGQIRIIGGQWRGRKLAVPDVPHLRPTPDRVRETLFNWLAPVIQDAHCLDPFAGSGALGFEALSRGAAQVVMVDADAAVVKLLKEEAAILKTNAADINQAHAPHQLKKPKQKFNIVFLDPPFQQDLLLPTCFYLAEHDFLVDDAWIYLEANKEIHSSDLPAGWEIVKTKKAGQVWYQLVRKNNIVISDLVRPNKSRTL